MPISPNDHRPHLPGQTYHDLEISKGNVPGHSCINKFGRTTNADNGVATDIWDRANAVNNQPIWLAPTAPRIHQIVSADAGDDGAPAGLGGQTMRIYGLRSWNQAQVTEDIVLNGVTNVPTTNEYVIIHRMEMLTWGATSTNIGLITATADTDGTVTAQIQAGAGQTQMAIYGIPRGQSAYVSQYYASLIGAVGGDEVLATLFWNPHVETVTTRYLTKHTHGIRGGGTSNKPHEFHPYYRFDGPGILKVQVTSDANDMDVSGGFDICLVSNA